VEAQFTNLGKISAMGKHTDLMKTSPRYKQMVEATEKKAKKEEDKPPEEDIPQEFLDTLKKVYNLLDLDPGFQPFKDKLAALIPELPTDARKSTSLLTATRERRRQMEESSSSTEEEQAHSLSSVELKTMQDVGSVVLDTDDDLI